MPWTPDSFRKKHWRLATRAQSRRAAAVANAVLRQTGDEGRAIASGIAAAKQMKPPR